ncbi:MAG: phenylalanine 4-monooxygenase, partial [Pseudohongiellaceae bacterium]
MAKASRYVAHQPDAQGHVAWQPDEHAIWQRLVRRQNKAIPGKACDEYLAGLDHLNLPEDRVPQLAEIDAVLTPATGWKTSAVP